MVSLDVSVNSNPASKDSSAYRVLIHFTFPRAVNILGCCLRDNCILSKVSTGKPKEKKTPLQLWKQKYKA